MKKINFITVLILLILISGIGSVNAFYWRNETYITANASQPAYLGDPTGGTFPWVDIGGSTQMMTKGYISNLSVFEGNSVDLSGSGASYVAGVGQYQTSGQVGTYCTGVNEGKCEPGKFFALVTGSVSSPPLSGVVQILASWGQGNESDFVDIPVASFSCTPTSQYPDADVVCTDTSTNTPTDWYWTLDYDALGIKGWQTSTSQNFTWQSSYTGLFGVNLRANNSAGFDWENKTNYVSISENATPNNCNVPVLPGLIRTLAQCKDGQSGAQAGCNLQLMDVNANSWSNATSPNGLWCIDTLPAHSLDFYADATGYTPVSRTGLPVIVGGITYDLVLWPSDLPPAPDGKITLYIIVTDAEYGALLSGASIMVRDNTGTTQAQTTSISGARSFFVSNSSLVYVSVSKSGYISRARTVSTPVSGTDTETISLQRAVITTQATSTIPPGGVTTAVTVDPNDPSITGSTTAKGQEMMNWLAMNGMSLVQLCFLVTILALLGVKLGK